MKFRSFSFIAVGPNVIGNLKITCYLQTIFDVNFQCYHGNNVHLIREAVILESSYLMDMFNEKLYVLISLKVIINCHDS